MSGRLTSYRRRLAKVERHLAVIARRSELANCNCDKTKTIIVHSDEELKAAHNVRCPAHGRRRVGFIVCIEHIGAKAGSASEEENTHLKRPTKIDKARLADNSDQGVKGTAHATELSQAAEEKV